MIILWDDMENEEPGQGSHTSRRRKVRPRGADGLDEHGARGTQNTGDAGLEQDEAAEQPHPGP